MIVPQSKQHRKRHNHLSKYKKCFDHYNIVLTGKVFIHIYLSVSVLLRIYIIIKIERQFTCSKRCTKHSQWFYFIEYIACWAKIPPQAIPIYSRIRSHNTPQINYTMCLHMTKGHFVILLRFSYRGLMISWIVNKRRTRESSLFPRRIHIYVICHPSKTRDITQLIA